MVNRDYLGKKLRSPLNPPLLSGVKSKKTKKACRDQNAVGWNGKAKSPP